MHVVLHGIAGALYQSVFWAAVCKNLPRKYEGIAISLISLSNNLMNSICPIITGKIVGNMMTKITARYCLILLIVLSSIGFISATYFALKENKSLREDIDNYSDIEIIN